MKSIKNKENVHVIYQRMTIRLVSTTTNCQETMHNMFKDLKKNSWQPNILYPTELSSRS